MTKRAPATGALLHQDPSYEGATLEKTSLTTNGTALDVAAKEATPSESRLLNAIRASCEQNITESQDHTAAHSTAVASSSGSISYRSAAVQTLPPNDAREFHKIYDREPTNQELISKTGSAAIGRYGPGLSANPHDVVLGSPFATATVSKRRANYTDSSFQTDDVAQCKKALLRAKVKASLLASGQRDAAQSAGFRVWCETRDEYIIHSEQFHVSVHFDDQGNAINANVDGLSLPNIYGEEIDPSFNAIKPMKPLHHEVQYSEAEISKEAKEYASSATSDFTPPPTPPSALLHNAVDDVSTQRIRSVEPRVPSEKSDPASIERYGYFQLAPRDAIEQDVDGDLGKDRIQQEPLGPEVGEQATMREQKDRSDDIVRKGETVMVIGGERFADEYIVYDATASTFATPTTPSDTHLATTKKRKPEDDWESEVATISPKRFKTSPARTNSLEAGTITQQDRFVQHREKYATGDDAKETGSERMQSSQNMGLAESQQVRFSTSHRTYEDKQETDDDRYSRTSRTHRDSRRRSRSPVDQRSANRCRSRSNVRRRSENPYEEERRRYVIARETDEESQPPRDIMTAHTDKQNRFTEGRESDGRDHGDLPHNDMESQSRQTESSRRLAKPSATEQRDLQQSRPQKDVDEIVLARTIEDDRRLEREQRIEEEKLARRRQLEEAEIQRARDAKNRRKLKIEEKRQLQEADRQRREEERDRARRRRRDDSQDRSRGVRRKTVDKTAELPEQVDEYATARKAEARRRERVFAARSIGENESRTREQFPAGNESFSRLKVERPKPENKVEVETVIKPRPSRTARGELERYDPRKKFGGGK